LRRVGVDGQGHRALFSKKAPACLLPQCGRACAG
jgi:hypothetical protein